MDEKELTASNFIQNDLLDLEKDEKHHLYKIVRNSPKENNFSLIAKFPVENAESTPLKNNASVVVQQVTRTRNKFLPKASCVIKGESVERKNLHSGLLDHSSRVNIRIRNIKRLAEQPKPKEESPTSSGKEGLC